MSTTGNLVNCLDGKRKNGVAGMFNSTALSNEAGFQLHSLSSNIEGWKAWRRLVVHGTSFPQPFTTKGELDADFCKTHADRTDVSNRVGGFHFIRVG